MALFDSHSRKLAAGIVAAAAIGLSGAASAATITITQIQTVPLTGVDFSQNLSFNYFNIAPSLGILESVTVTETGTLTSTATTLANSTSHSASGRAGVASDFFLNTVSGSPVAVDNANFDLYFDQTNTYSIAAHGSTGWGPKTTTLSQVETFTSPADLAGFIGTGSFLLDFNTASGTTLTGAAHWVSLPTSTGSGIIEIQYTYQTVPATAPGTGLFGLGFLILAFAARSGKKLFGV